MYCGQMSPNLTWRKDKIVYVCVRSPVCMCVRARAHVHVENLKNDWIRHLWYLLLSMMDVLFCGERGWRFDSSEGNQAKGIKSIIWFYKEMLYHQPCAWLDKTSPFTNALLHSWKVKFYPIKHNYHEPRKRTIFRNYDLAASISWPLSHWISIGWILLVSWKRRPKECKKKNLVRDESLEKSTINFFLKTFEKTDKNL